MPETEADAEPDTGDSQSGGTISNVDEEGDSDVDEKVIAILAVDHAKRQKKNELHAS